MKIEREKLIERIRIDPEVLCGKPVVRGMRISVELVLDLPSSGMTEDEILAEYPSLEREDLLACLAYV